MTNRGYKRFLRLTFFTTKGENISIFTPNDVVVLRLTVNLIETLLLKLLLTSVSVNTRKGRTAAYAVREGRKARLHRRFLSLNSMQFLSPRS